MSSKLNVGINIEFGFTKTPIPARCGEVELYETRNGQDTSTGEVAAVFNLFDSAVALDKYTIIANISGTRQIVQVEC